MKKYLNGLVFSLALLSMLTLVANTVWATSDERISEERKVGSFKGISVGGAFEVILTQGNENKLVVEAEEDQMEKVIAEVRGDLLRIRYESSRWERNHEKITLYISFKELNELDISGACDVKSETPLKTDELDLEFSGAASAWLNLDVDYLKADISGAGDLNLEGRADEQKVESSGASKYKAYELESKRAFVRTSGAGSIRLYVTEELEANASGAASIRYKGNPEKFYANSSAAASVRKAN